MLRGNQEYWASFGGSETMSLNVQCGSTSTVLTEGSFSGSFSTVQWIDKNQAGGFVLPAYTTTLASCPAEQFQVSDNNWGVTQPASGFVLDGVETFPGSGVFMVKPQDDSLDMKYNFYMIVTARGGYTFYSQLYTLIVGCTSDMTLSEDPAIVLSGTGYVNQGLINVFQVIKPIISPSYCNHLPVSNYVVNEKINGTSTPGAVSISTACMGI